MADLEQSAEHLFGEALDLPPERRAAFLDETCQDAPELRRLVDALLRDHERAGSFLAQPLLPHGEISLHVQMNPPEEAVRFQAGQTIAERFLVVRFIARGGMGEVYEVEDKQLQDASVALKIIRPELAADAASTARFAQEVLLARKVVHPSLCPIYEIYRCEQPAPAFLFLTMRLLQGETLDARLKTSPSLNVDEATGICSQLIAGVAALHAGGIIHRDLKPNNVMLEEQGPRTNVSIMDFGLARLQESENTHAGTGMIAGTPGYLAPELLRGGRPTKATDLYALGVVMHQVLTGQRPVESDGGLSVTPSPSLRTVHAPTPLVEAVTNFLSADPEKRESSFRRVSLAHETDRSAAAFVRRPSPWRRRLIWVSFAATVLLLMLVVAIWMTPPAVSGPLDSTQITFAAQPKEGPLFTDGSRLYFESRGVPSEMATHGGLIVPVPQVPSGMRLMNIPVDGTGLLEWKPEPGDEIGRGSLWIGSLLGGALRRVGHSLVNTPDWGGGASWSPDGKSIYLSDQRTLYSAEADGTNVKKIWEAPRSIDGAFFSPNGKELAVSLWSSTDSSRIWKLNLDGSNPHPLIPNWPSDSAQWLPQWTPDGRHFTFLSDREGRANAYEWVKPRWFEFWKKPSAVRITGNQIPIIAAIPARDSSRLFVIGRMDEGAMQALDPRTGQLEPFLGGLAASEFTLSPDGQWMAYSDYPSGNLWKSKLDLSEPLQLTTTPAYALRWSPDGKSLVFTDSDKLYVVSADGGTPEKLIAEGNHEVSPNWVPGGKAIAFCHYNFTDQPSGGIFTVDLASRKVAMMPHTEGLTVPSWSPDGKFLVAIARNPSRMMLYSSATGAWTVLTTFEAPWGFWAWTRDSKSLYMGLTQGQNGIYHISVPDGKWQKVSRFDGSDLGHGPLGNGNSYVSLTADGQPAMMHYTGVGQIFALHWKH